MDVEKSLMVIIIKIQRAAVHPLSHHWYLLSEVMGGQELTPAVNGFLHMSTQEKKNTSKLFSGKFYTFSFHHM